ncbi:MAG: rhomboid family intramembrane serine protease [Bacteroidia bacterium]|nr:rhomboid family intramembrane serine protease [Bacteroidia bacterium]
MVNELKNAFSRHNNAHVRLIIVNVIVFVVLVMMRVLSAWFDAGEIFSWLHGQLAIPAPILSFIQKPWTIITYAFVHDLNGIIHILFNMLVFYWFGKLFVEYLGSDKLIALYMLGAIAGGVAYLLVYNLIPYYMGRVPELGMVGASAAVYAVLVATATLLPDYTFFLFLLGPVRIKYIAGFYILISFVGSVGANEGGNIAHLGGAIIGFVYIKQLHAGVNWGQWIIVLIEWFREIFRSKPKVKVTYRSTAPPKGTKKKSEYTQDEIDAILDKISEGGYESLTKEEKEKLFNASKKQ